MEDVVFADFFGGGHAVTVARNGHTLSGWGILADVGALGSVRALGGGVVTGQGAILRAIHVHTGVGLMAAEATILTGGAGHGDTRVVRGLTDQFGRTAILVGETASMGRIDHGACARDAGGFRARITVIT